jgi:hypothetical protein
MCSYMKGDGIMKERYIFKIIQRLHETNDLALLDLILKLLDKSI